MLTTSAGSATEGNPKFPIRVMGQRNRESAQAALAEGTSPAPVVMQRA
jgi:hypothetical protein